MIRYAQIGNCTLIRGDCLDVMPLIDPSTPEDKVDMILCDLPYGTTQCKWDTIIPFEHLWKEYKRLCGGAIVLTASQPFTSALVMSNLDWFKYAWVWEKSRPLGFFDANRKPLKTHEDVCVFCKGYGKYNPQGCTPSSKRVKRTKTGDSFGDARFNEYTQEKTNYPRSIIAFASEGKQQHPTQKPVALMEYLIRTYTNEGQKVLDNCMGSGTTGVACINTDRKFIGIEKDPKYFDICVERITSAYKEKQAVVL